MRVNRILLFKKEINSQKVRVEFSLKDMDMSEFQKGDTYDEVKTYVLEKYGLKMLSLYIAQIKEKLGIKEHKCYNMPKAEDSMDFQAPQDEEVAVIQVPQYFRNVWSLI